MKISYFNTIDDIEEGIKIYNKSNFLIHSSEISLKLVPGAIIPLYGTYLSIDMLKNNSIAPALCTLLIAIFSALYAYFLLPKLSDKKFSNKIRENKKFLESISKEIILVITDIDMTFLLEPKNKTIKFENVKNIIEHNERIFIIGEKKMIEAIIPYRAFSSPLTKNEFLEIISKTKNL